MEIGVYPPTNLIYALYVGCGATGTVDGAELCKGNSIPDESEIALFCRIQKRAGAKGENAYSVLRFFGPAGPFIDFYINWAGLFVSFRDVLAVKNIYLYSRVRF